MNQLFGGIIVIALGAFCLAHPATPAFAQVGSPAKTPRAAPNMVASSAQSLTTDVDNPVKQADQVVTDLATGDAKALHRGPLLIHGNYCGIGNRPGTTPIDSLDAACMRHDACTKTDQLPNCSCNERLRKEATDIAEDPATPTNIQVVATAIAAGMALLICR